MKLGYYEKEKKGKSRCVWVGSNSSPRDLPYESKGLDPLLCNEHRTTRLQKRPFSYGITCSHAYE